MTAPIDHVINRLEKVRSVGSGRYLSRCPAHEDRSPSLSVSEGDDGRVLIRCFAGCGVPDIVAALGLEMKDLFHKDGLSQIEKRRYHQRKTIAEIEKALWHELLVLLQFVGTRVSDRQNGCDPRYRLQRPEFQPMNDEPWDRELLATRRIRRGLELRYGR
ncbi:MAG: hypothetical protein KZQ90_19845 [Candidatus Thiodiazotropha sp. (ex Codakia rugifera)]|nr:hypothetical protein [Candidatus Thiodiazotropha sp. (ex Codakia rugifera)]